MTKEFDLHELSDISREILSASPHKILLFYGEMGAGKTTLIKELCKQLGSFDEISSPTFSLVNEYLTGKNEPIYHFDFYRVEEEEEAYDIGIEDYFDSNSWCFVEWPQNIQNLLPLESTIVKIDVLANEKRQIQLIKAS